MSLNLSTFLNVFIDDREDEGSGYRLDPFSFSNPVLYGDGTGAGNVNVQWNASRTMAGTSEDIDIAGGVTNRKGRVVTFSDVKGIVVKASASNAGNLTLRTSVTNGWTTLLSGDVTIRPGGVFFASCTTADGHAVTAGTGDVLRVLGASGYQYEIGIWGEGTEA